MLTRQLCELCHRNGLRSHLEAYQINLDEAVYLCENIKCSYPIGLHEDSVTFARSLTDVPASKPRDVAPKVPPAQVALQNQAASQMGPQGQMCQRGVTATQTSRPNSINSLKLRNGLVNTNGLTNGQRKPERFNFSTDNKRSKASSHSRSRSHSNSISPNFTTFQFGHKHSRETTQQTNCQERKLDCSPGAVSQQNVLPQSADTIPSSGTCGSAMSSNTSRMSDTSNSVSIAHARFTSIDLKSVKSVTCHTDLLLRKTAAKLGVIAETVASKPEDIVLPDIAIPVESVSTDSNSTAQYKTGKIVTSPFVNCSDSKQPGDNVHPEYPNMFLQWTNKDALCWLDVVLCLLVHNKTLQSAMREVGLDQSTVINKLLVAQQQAQNILLSLEKRKSGDTDGASLGKLIDASQLTGTSNGRGRPLTRILTVVSPSGTDGVSVKTGAGSHINTTAEQAVRSENPDASCETLTSELNKAQEIMNGVREDIWEHLKPSLKCEKGQNDSPVFAFPLMFRDNPAVQELFRIKGRYIYNCTHCGLAETNDVDKIVPTFPAVVKQFDIRAPVHKKKCLRCGMQEQRKLVYEKLPACLLMHFMEGLPHNHWHWLEFDFDGRRYTVTGVVQYMNNPDHFIAWLRNPTNGQWMKCDDLASPITVFHTKPPPFPPKQIHIVMWEATQSLNTVPASVDVSGNTSMTTVPLEISGSMKKCGIWSSASSVCSEMSECQDLPEFVSSVPLVQPIMKPIACWSEAKHLNGETDMKADEAIPFVVNDITSKNSDNDHRKLSGVPLIVHKPQPVKANLAISDIVKSSEEGCAVNVLHPVIGGHVPVIKPSSVFTAPAKDKETKLNIHDMSFNKSSSEAVCSKQSLTLVKGPVQKLDQASSPAVLPGGQNRFKVIFAKVHKPSQGMNGNTNSVDKLIPLSTTEIRKDLPNSSAPRIQTNKQNYTLELMRRSNNCSKFVDSATKPALSRAQKCSESGPLCVTPSQRNIPGNGATPATRTTCLVSHSSSTTDSRPQGSSAALANSQITKKTSPGSFKQPPKSVKLLRSLKASSLTKANGASLSRDAFKTMKFGKSTGTNGISTSNSISPVSNGAFSASSNGSPPHDSALPPSGNLNYLSAVKQYLLNKSTNVAAASQFKGMSLKSRSSDCMLNFTDNLSETIDCRNYSKRIVSPQSEYFGRKASSPHQSTVSDNLLQAHRKRKSDSDIYAPGAKRVMNSLDNNKEVSQQQPLKLSRSKSLENHPISAFTKLHDRGTNPIGIKLNGSKSPSPQKSETSSTNTHDTDDILQELYQALDIPLETVGDTMSNIMSDVDDILGLVQSTDTQVFMGLDPSQSSTTSPVTVPGFSVAGTTASAVVSQAGPTTEGLVKGR